MIVPRASMVQVFSSELKDVQRCCLNGAVVGWF